MDVCYWVIIYVHICISISVFLFDQDSRYIFMTLSITAYAILIHIAYAWKYPSKYLYFSERIKQDVVYYCVRFPSQNTVTNGIVAVLFIVHLVPEWQSYRWWSVFWEIVETFKNVTVFFYSLNTKGLNIRALFRRCVVLIIK